MNPEVKATAGLRELCRLGLHPEVLVPAVLEALHAVVPSTRNLFDWSDDTGQLLHYCFEGPIDTTIAQLYFAEFHNRLEAQAMPPFAALKARAGGIHSARELDTPRFFDSALYHEIWRPQGLKYRVEAVVRGSRGQLLGSLVLYRGPGERCFSADEERRLAPVLPAFAAGLELGARRQAIEQWVPATDPPETVTLDARGQLLHATAGAARLLMLADRGITPAALAAGSRWMGHGLLSLVRRRLEQQAPATRGGGGVSLVHDCERGRFVFDARRLQALDASPESGPGLTLVTITRHEPRQLAVERALRGLNLTPGQHQVCRELISGRPQAEIAQALGIAPASVVDQVRKLYRSLGVRSPLELRALIDSHTAS